MKTDIKKTTMKEKTFPVFRASKVVYLPLSQLTCDELNEMFENISSVARDHPKKANHILDEIRKEFQNRQYDPFLIENDVEGFVIDQLNAQHLEINMNNVSISIELERKIDSQSVEVQKLISEMIWRYQQLIYS